MKIMKKAILLVILALFLAGAFFVVPTAKVANAEVTINSEDGDADDYANGSR